MAGRNYDRKPFDADDEINPFSNPRNVNSVPNSKLSHLPAEPAKFYHQGDPIDIPLDTTGDLKKAKELRAKEAELNKREEILRQKEKALARAGVVLEEKNWPPFLPIIHHNIASEIPAYLHKMQYVAFATLLGVPVCLLWNVIALTSTWINNGDVRVFFLSIIYFIVGVPGAYFCWYRPLYHAVRNDSGMRFGWFLFFYLIHIGFFIFAAVAPPIILNGLYFAGFMSAVTVIGSNALIGIFYFIGAGLFTAEAVVSIWVFQRVYRYFRGTGKAAEMKHQIAMTGARAAMG